MVTNTYLLVNLVDNDFQKENCLWDLLDYMIEMRKNLSGLEKIQT
jgi:hypothetical protein